MNRFKFPDKTTALPLQATSDSPVQPSICMDQMFKNEFAYVCRKCSGLDSCLPCAASTCVSLWPMPVGGQPFSWGVSNFCCSHFCCFEATSNNTVFCRKTWQVSEPKPRQVSSWQPYLPSTSLVFTQLRILDGVYLLKAKADRRRSGTCEDLTTHRQIMISHGSFGRISLIQI